MKKKIKIIFVVLAIASMGGVCYKGISSYINMARLKGLVTKISETALEKNIDLDSNAYERTYLYSYQTSDYFSAKDELSKRIEKTVLNHGWVLDSQDSITCGENSIDYHGNIQGNYLLDGEDEADRYWRPVKYTAWEDLSLNEDGSRKREYVPKEQDYLDQVRLTVQTAIDETLTEEEKAQFTDINICITSDPDFDQFIQDDYRLYTSSQKMYERGAKRYTLLLIFYIFVLVAFLLNSTGKKYIAKWIVSIAALVMLFAITKDFFKTLTVIAVSVFLLYFVLRILTLNHFSRTFFFSSLGIILGLAFNEVFSKGYTCGNYNTDLWFIIVSNIFMCLMLALDHKALLDEYIERR